MVKFYTEMCDVPDGLEVVRDNEEYFARVTIKKLDVSVGALLKHTDKCSYVDSRRFKDRFGYDLPWRSLSTGGKTVLNAYYSPDKVFSCIECGQNALIDATHLSEGMFVDGVPFSYSDTDNVSGDVNGETYSSVKEVKDAYC